MVSTSNQLNIKLFTGFYLTSELRMHLQDSQAWKLKQITSSGEDLNLCLVHLQGKDFLGRFMTHQSLSLEELVLEEQNLRNFLKNYCPRFDSKRSILVVFPQFFIS